MRIEAIDLNLLPSLAHLLETRSVGEAAKRMGVTQSTMSHRLAQLRDVLDDPVLERKGRVMLPTTMAEQMLPAVHRALAAAKEALGHPEDFDVSRDDATFTVGAMDLEVSFLLAPLIRRWQKQAPRARLKVAPIDTTFIEKMERGDFDLLLLPKIGTGIAMISEQHRMDDWVCRPLFADRWVCVMGAGQGASGEPLTLESFAARSHVIVSPNGNWKTPIDGILGEHGLRRRVVATVPALGQALHIVRSSECVTTMPSALVRFLAPDLTILELPLDVPPLEHAMWWNPRTTRSSRHRWLREEVRAVAEESYALMTQGH